ncbi:uncharacterized protein LOC135122202 [Zophobas morio]|uniref:uncharacterized protein LOC135122202 n=1 Tax=Zophobas morio TaxID=2755281 RepID=UPI003082F5AB
MAHSWMSHLKDKRLGEVWLPCSHNSATDRYSFLSEYLCESILSLFSKRWDRCQNKTLYEQLLLGIRAVDLRLFTDKNNVTWTCHGFVNQKLEKVICQVACFLIDHPTEFVLILIKQGWLSLTRRHWEVNWLQVNKLIAKFDKSKSQSSDYFIEEVNSPSLTIRHKLSTDLFLSELAGSVAFVSEEENYRFGFRYHCRDLLIYNSWYQTNTSLPSELPKNLLNLISSLPAQKPKNVLLWLNAHCTPTARLIVASYNYFVPNAYRSLYDLHRKSLSFVLHDFLQSDSIKNLDKIKIRGIISSDFVDEKFVNAVISLNF